MWGKVLSIVPQSTDEVWVLIIKNNSEEMPVIALFKVNFGTNSATAEIQSIPFKSTTAEDQTATYTLSTEVSNQKTMTTHAHYVSGTFQDFYVAAKVDKV